MRLSRQEWGALAGLGFCALLIRVFFLPAAGHVTDLGTFEAWTRSLITYGSKNFYAHAGFVDYPPGYMLVLWLAGTLYKATFMAHDASLLALKVFVKLPAVLADLALTYVVYLIVRRAASVPLSLIAAAVIALNPAVWIVSAYWGQADSVAAVFLVWAIYLAITERYEWAWAALAFAVLVKPQPLVAAPLLAAWQIRRIGFTPRLLLAPVAGLTVALFGSLPFAPSSSPASVLAWLYGRYHNGMDVYPYNSCNAFNLYSVFRDFWQSDSLRILGVPQWGWGVGIFTLLLVALVMRQWRTTAGAAPQAEQSAGARLLAERSFFTACFLALLGLFMLTTRMHERYMFSALALAPLVWNAGRFQKVATCALSATFVANLFYALQYLFKPGPDLHPFEVHALSLVNVVCFFLVAGGYLIDEMGTAVERWFNPGAAKEAAPPAQRAAARRVPLVFEGLRGLTTLDYLIAGGLSVATLLLLVHNIGTPKERIFDEIYYARAAQEYLSHKDIYEYTHPPLTKLIMTVGAWFFGKFGYGDPVGARMMSAIFGSLTVPLLYAFAKRLFSSTAAAALSAFLLITSGYFYVQSRIATPEIFLAFFSLATLYCAYRYWIASQIVRARVPTGYADWRTFLGAAGVLGAALVYAFVQGRVPSPYVYAAFVIALSAYCAAGIRSAQNARGAKTVFPDGSYLDGDAAMLPAGERRKLKAPPLSEDDQRIEWTPSGARVRQDGDELHWRSSGVIDGTGGAAPVRDTQQWLVWLLLSGLAVGCVTSSKWNGLFDLAAVCTVAALASAQQLLPALWRVSAGDGRPPGGRFVWGNPFGWRLPLLLGVTLCVTAIVYFICFIPNFNLGTGHDFAYLVNLQSSMFHYHYTLLNSHPYSSKWWTWPFELRPVPYWWHQFGRAGASNPLVAEVLALPNPAVWLAGVVSVPLAAWLGWRERHKGIMLLIAARRLPVQLLSEPCDNLPVQRLRADAFVASCARRREKPALRARGHASIRRRLPGAVRVLLPVAEFRQDHLPAMVCPHVAADGTALRQRLHRMDLSAAAGTC